MKKQHITGNVNDANGIQAEDVALSNARLMEIITDAVISTDPDFIIKSWNKAAEKIYGWTEEEAMGRNIDELLLTHFPYGGHQISFRQLLEEDHHEMEVEHKAKNGHAVGIRENLSIMRDREDHITGTMAIMRDMTEQKNMQLELQIKAEELIQKSKLITEFFTNISHEFKTPLAVILMQIELMQLYMGDEKKINEFMAAATQNFNRLARLVSNLLDITKIDAGYLKANYAKADIVTLTKEICNSVAPYAKARAIRLCYKTSLTGKIMPIDIEKIERIMLNLLSNAIKHTGTDGEISVTLKERKDGGIIISVEDTGEGIPENMLNIIFDRFALVNTSLTRHTEGCGIGLSLVKSLVDMLGGTIRVKSEVGKGSKFDIGLPMQKAESDHQAIEVEGYDLCKKAAMEMSDLCF